MAVEVRPRTGLLPSVTRALLVAVLFTIACDSAVGPTPPTANPFPLPAGAPSDAEAPPGTTRVTITAVEITDGTTRVKPTDLNANGPPGGYAMRVWIFCPAGLQGPVGSGATREVVDFVITKRNVALNTGGESSGLLRLDSGYNTVEDRLATATPGHQSVRIEIRRNFAVVATAEFVATFN